MKPFLRWLTELNFSKNMIHWIESFFSTWLTVLKPSFWTCLKELNHFSFKKYKSKNWTHFKIWLKELNPFFHIAQWNGFFFLNILKELNLFWIWYNYLNLFSIWFKEFNIFRKCNSENLFCFWKLLNFSLNIDSKKSFFIFWKWVEELNLFFWILLKELNIFSISLNFFQHESKNWFFFFLNMTHRIDFFFWIWLTELNLFLNMTQRIELFLFWVQLKELNSFSDMTQRIELFCWIRLKELNLFIIRLEELNLFLLCP